MSEPQILGFNDYADFDSEMSLLRGTMKEPRLVHLQATRLPRYARNDMVNNVYKNRARQTLNNQNKSGISMAGSTSKATAITLKGQGAAGRFLFWSFFLFRQKKKGHSLTLSQAHPIPNEELKISEALIRQQTSRFIQIFQLQTENSNPFTPSPTPSLHSSQSSKHPR
ncbi:MAG: hypothetical protein EOP46_19585 [Sphingobacteriaceae bacterium]|nr:MAG: hypothetical protein EOP46_19585 [Sphingobacteriaceae bacterium]